MERWVKLYGKLLNSQYFKEPKLLQLVIYCLLKAQWRASDIIFNGQLLHIEPGEFITGRQKISQDTGLTNRNVRTRLKILERSGFLTMRTTKRFTRIQVNNWHIYQGMKNGDQVIDQQTTNRRPTDDQVIDHIQEVKKDKKDKECKETIPPQAEGQNQKIITDLYLKLLEENEIKYIPPQKEYIVFSQGFNRYKKKGATVPEVIKLMEGWFENGIGEWCGYKLSNFWGDVGKIQLANKPRLTKSQQAMKDFVEGR